jgi:DNA-binding response OmpR family regulator
MDAQRIMVIDDEFEIRTLICEYLETIGYQVTIAASGTEALSLLDSDPAFCDLALVDWNLPGISGRDVIEAIRHRSPGTRIVVTTGDPPESLRSNSLPPPWSDVVLKPFGLRQLRDCIAGVLALEIENSTSP